MRYNLTKIVVLILIIIVSFSFTSFNTCQAVSDVTEDPDFWKPNDEDISTALDEKIEIIVAVVKTVGILISVGTLSVIGIKFMLGSIEERAQYKQTLIPWLIGATLLFTLTTLPSFLYGIIQGANETSEVNISLSTSNITLKIGENDEAKILAVVTVDGVKSTTKVKWSSSNNQIATVDENGKVTAKSNGTATITASSSKAKATCKVTVETPETTEITLSTTSVKLEIPNTTTYKLNTTVMPASSNETVFWSSSNPAVAKVNNGIVTAVGKGTAVITAKSGTKSATCTVEVTEAFNIERVYEAMYYNESTKKVSSSKTSDKDLGFWIYIPEASKVSDVNKLPMIVYLHGFEHFRK